MHKMKKGKATGADEVRLEIVEKEENFFCRRSVTTGTPAT